MTWKTPVVLTKPMLSIRKEIALFISLVSTFPGKLNDFELKALACTKRRKTDHYPSFNFIAEVGDIKTKTVAKKIVFIILY